MTTNFERIQSVFMAALERPADNWESFLAETCRDDQELRQQVQLLLRAHQSSGPLDVASATLENRPDTAFSQPDLRRRAETTGSLIGRYKLLQQIGEGGFGVVYMAEQERPVKRRVALKIIKAGMDTRAVIARFEAERQALAMMDHPNIARVLDVGETDTGRPYFVMELVKGIPITEYCDQTNLSTRQRLELFVDVCHAVQHAHLKGIIHRDLKPSNIMVTLRDDRPNVKVIDFGIAKATEQTLTEKTLFTNYGQMIGTPVYMSPEQAAISEFDVDTRSDVYSLGVLLYELLAGSPPFDAQTLRKAGFDEMRRIIREESPQKPSTKLNTLAQETRHTVAAHRQASPQVLSRQLNGDLDWIVLKAIEKDRARRYESASAFAQDVQRHLNAEAVFAGAPGLIYKLRKFAKRNKAVLAIAAILALLLLSGTAVSLWQAVRATRAGKAEAAQRVAAQRAELQAVAHQREADAQRQRADAETLRAQEQLSRANQLLYASKLLLAQTDFEAGSGGMSQHYLDECQPNLRDWEYRYLQNRLSPRQNLVGHTDHVSSAAFSPDGTRIVTGSEDGTAKVWDTATAQPLFTLRAETTLVMSVAFSPDGKQIVTGGGDWGLGKHRSEVKVWNAETGGLIFDLKGHAYCVWSVAFSPDGKLIASGAGDWADGPGEVKVWNARTGHEECAMSDIPSSVRGLAFSRDSSRITSGSVDGTRVWNALTGQKILQLQGEGSVIRGIAYSPDGKRFATVNFNLTANVWDADTGRKLLTLTGHSAFLTGVAFSPDGKTIATSCGDRSVRVWDAATGALVFIIKGHAKSVRSVAFSPNGKAIVTASDDNSASVWDVENGQEIHTLRGHGEGVNCVAFSPDSRCVATCSRDGTARIWSAVTTRQMLSLTVSSHPGGTPDTTGLWSVAFSPDGRRIVVGSQEKNATVWDSTTGKLLLTLPHDNVVSCVVYSPDGTRILTGMSIRDDESDHPGEAKIWDARTGRQLLALKHPRGVWCAAYNRDGSQIATASGDMWARVWDANSGNLLVAVKEYSGGINSVAFSPDGKRIVTASRDNTARVWDAMTGKLILTLTGHTAVVRSAVYSPDGRRIVTGSDDMSVKLWDSESGLEVFSLHDLPQSVYSVAFSPDGRSIGAGFTGVNGTVRLWYAPTTIAK